MRDRIVHRFAAATVLLSMLVVSAATGGVWLRCRITGVLQPACCCPGAEGADDSTPTPTPPSAQAGDCCDRVVTDVEQAPSELAARVPADGPALAVAPADAGEPPSIAPRATSVAGVPSRAGPTSTRARLLSKSAFLI